MKVTRLTVYPVKSMGAEDVGWARVTPQGLDGDRRWAVLDAYGDRVSARECHGLLGFLATVRSDGLLITARDGALLHVLVPGADAPRVPTQISRLDELVLADESASGWLSERVGRPLRLAYQRDPLSRAIAAEHGGLPGETMSLADTGPLLLVTEASLVQLGEWVAESQQQAWLDPYDAARRFRPNVIVEGSSEPFAEDSWQRVQIGEVTYRRTELCDRCVMTTIDLDTLQTTKEPIRTLAQHRRWDGATWFGIRLVPELPTAPHAPEQPTGLIRVGAPVSVLEG